MYVQSVSIYTKIEKGAPNDFSFCNKLATRLIFVTVSGQSQVRAQKRDFVCSETAGTNQEVVKVKIKHGFLGRRRTDQNVWVTFPSILLVSSIFNWGHRSQGDSD